MKLLVFLLIVYLGYRALKSLLFPAQPRQQETIHRSDRQIDDIMIKDPYCQVYFPQKSGVHLNVNGADLYFCSEACRDKFIASGYRKK